MAAYLKKTFADHFEGKDSQKEIDAILQVADELAELIENKFIEKNCDDENLPLFDFEINLNEND